MIRNTVGDWSNVEQNDQSEDTWYQDENGEWHNSADEGDVHEEPQEEWQEEQPEDQLQEEWQEEQPQNQPQEEWQEEQPQDDSGQNWEISDEESQELDRIKEIIRLYTNPEG